MLKKRKMYNEPLLPPSRTVIFDLKTKCSSNLEESRVLDTSGYDFLD
jgi:hypothetical protein